MEKVHMNISLLQATALIISTPMEHYLRTTGGVVERLMAPVLKTGRAKALVGSNPTPSAVRQANRNPKFQRPNPKKSARQGNMFM